MYIYESRAPFFSQGKSIGWCVDCSYVLVQKGDKCDVEGKPVNDFK